MKTDLKKKKMLKKYDFAEYNMIMQFASYLQLRLKFQADKE